MTEPVTTNCYMIIPNTGDLPGSWGTSALNPNFNILDGRFGGVVTIALTSATTITLSTPPSSGVWNGSTGQINAGLLVFTGAQSGNSVIKFPLPGMWIVNNKCTGTSYVQLSPAAGVGNSIGAPPGRKAYVFYDGTDMDYVDMQEVGSALDLHGIATTPPWMLACTVRPYLVKDGSLYNVSTYPQLGQLLGSTFGGNGITTFAVPDERSRARIGIDIASVQTGTLAGRLLGTSGMTGTLMGSAGGNEALQSHNHTITDPGHNHNSGNFNILLSYTNGTGSSPGTDTTPGEPNLILKGNIQTSVTGLTLATTGVGTGQNMQPSIVSFLPLIKT